MRVLISGSTGLVGTALVAHLHEEGHEPDRLVRTRRPSDTPVIEWDPAAGTLDHDALAALHAEQPIDAVVHLAGQGIADRRWTKQQKAEILSSRVDGTTLLAESTAALSPPPRVFLSGSAVGFYGDRGDEILDEQSSRGEGFAADVVVAWEAATAPLAATQIRVVHLRTGVVLSAAGGALREQLPFFRLGLGGRIRPGTQWMSWISIHDAVRAITWLMDAPVEGPVNLVSPEPVTNAEFTSSLGRALRRPTWLPTPRWVLWAKLGRELTSELLLSSARASSRALLDAVVFEQWAIDEALDALLNPPDDEGRYSVTDTAG